jgi:hypothetical protein
MRGTRVGSEERVHLGHESDCLDVKDERLKSAVFGALKGDSHPYVYRGLRVSCHHLAWRLCTYDTSRSQGNL